MRKCIFGLIASMFVISCSDYKYPQDMNISERNGALVDSSEIYLPSQIEYAGVIHKFNWNSKICDFVNSYYLQTSEPILYNFYLGRQMYRVLVEKENKSPLIITVNRDGGKVWVVSKRIKEIEQIAPACGIEVVTDFDNYTRELSSEEVAEFDVLLKKINIYEQLSADVEKQMSDYSLIEAHEKGKYWVVYRSLDDNELNEFIDFVVGLTKFNYDMQRLQKLPKGLILG